MKGVVGVNVDDWYRWGAASPFKNILRMCEGVTDGVLHLEMNQSHEVGDYVCRYTGTFYSALKYVPADEKVSPQKNVATFQHDGNLATLRVTVPADIDPREIVVSRQADVGGFREKYIEHLAKFRLFRTMTPQRMNHARSTEPVGNEHFQGREGEGASYSVLLDLFRAIQIVDSTRPIYVWVHKHYDDSFEDFASFVSTLLGYGFYVIVELGNEWFNTKFYHGALAKQKAGFGYRVWGALRQGEFCQAIRHHVGANDNLITVFGTQLNGPGFDQTGHYTIGTTDKMLDALEEAGTLAFVDMMAVPGYFGSGYIVSSDWPEDWRQMAEAVFERLVSHRQYAKDNDMLFGVYEANHSVTDPRILQVYQDEASGEFYDYYTRELQLHADFAAFYSDIQDPRSRNDGSVHAWGLSNYLGEDTPRRRAVLGVLNEVDPPIDGKLDYETFVKYADRYMNERFPSVSRFEEVFYTDDEDS